MSNGPPPYRGPPPSYDNVAAQKDDAEQQPVQIKADEICLKVDPNAAQEYAGKDQSTRASSIPPNRDTDKEQEHTAKYTIDTATVILHTDENSVHASTTTLPRLVRKVPSVELLPTGWKSTDCLLIASYISVLLCLVTGVFANKYAWRAKRNRGRGLY